MKNGQNGILKIIVFSKMILSLDRYAENDSRDIAIFIGLGQYCHKAIPDYREYSENAILVMPIGGKNLGFE